MRLGIGVCGFQSEKEIPRLLDPIWEHVYKIYYVDGKYPAFKWPSDYSTDDTRKVLRKYPNAVYDRLAGEQIDKRNRYLDLANEDKCDFVLVLDTDDYLSRKKKYQDWTLFYKQLEKLPAKENLANILFWISPLWRKNWNLVNDQTWTPYTRIIRPDKIKYDISHWTYVPRDYPNTFDMAERTLQGLRFTANSTLRTEEYKEAGFDWAKKQMDEENARFEEPRAKRMKFNFWCRQITKALRDPDTEIIEGQDIVDQILKDVPPE